MADKMTAELRFTDADARWIAGAEQLLRRHGYGAPAFTSDQDASAFYNLGNEMLRGGFYRAALLLYLRTVVIAPNAPDMPNPSAWKNAGTAARGLGLFSLAEGLYRQANQLFHDASVEPLIAKAVSRSSEGSMMYWNTSSHLLPPITQLHAEAKLPQGEVSAEWMSLLAVFFSAAPWTGRDPNRMQVLDDEEDREDEDDDWNDEDWSDEDDEDDEDEEQDSDDRSEPVMLPPSVFILYGGRADIDDPINADLVYSETHPSGSVLLAVWDRRADAERYLRARAPQARVREVRGLAIAAFIDRYSGVLARNVDENGTPQSLVRF